MAESEHNKKNDAKIKCFNLFAPKLLKIDQRKKLITALKKQSKIFKK
jgi:hypothetical protein